MKTAHGQEHKSMSEGSMVNITKYDDQLSTWHQSSQLGDWGLPDSWQSNCGHEEPDTKLNRVGPKEGLLV